MSDVNYQFSRFGTKMIPLAILTIIALILLIIGINLWPILFVAYIFQVVALGILISVTGQAREANKTLNNVDLERFHSKIKTAAILSIIGLPHLYLAIVLIGNIFFIPFIIIAFILLLISAIKRIQGWGALSSFFKQDELMLKESKYSTAATLLMVSGILYIPIFFIYGLIGSLILEIIGFFLLLSLKDLSGEPAAKPTAQPAKVAAKTPAEPAKAGGKGFCPNCGSPVEGKEKYCGSCGSEI